jgi:hypothetical protein
VSALGQFALREIAIDSRTNYRCHEYTQPLQTSCEEIQSGPTNCGFHCKLLNLIIGAAEV